MAAISTDSETPCARHTRVDIILGVKYERIDEVTSLARGLTTTGALVRLLYLHCSVETVQFSTIQKKNITHAIHDLLCA